MKVNWLVRFKNKSFWLAIVPAALLLVTQVAAIFGFSLDFTDLQVQVLAVIETVFVILTILGVVVDPTTDDWSDSGRALDYSNPAPNVKQTKDGD